MFVDLPLEQLREYQPDVAEPEDFEDFWSVQLARAREHDLAARAEPARTPIRSARVYDVTFAGHGGSPIRAWLLLPLEELPGAPVVVQYVGYGGGRGDALEQTAWSCAGFPHLVMDTRGQGGGWRTADTADPGEAGAPSSPGFMTRGIGSAQTYYYTRLFVDAARAVEAARVLVDGPDRRVVVTGGSQGGGLALAAAHLAGDVAGCLPDVPFLAHVRRACEITAAAPYAEIAQYCRLRPQQVDGVFRTLSYVDVANHARRVHAPGLFSVGLQDEITPASTVFTAYHRYAGEKRIEVYPFSGHEGGGVAHLHHQITFATELAGPAG